LDGGLANVPMNSLVEDPANLKRGWDVAMSACTGRLNWARAISVREPVCDAIAAELLFLKQDRMVLCATLNKGDPAMAP
jgi:hypothetical protein